MFQALMKRLGAAGVAPPMSETERAALEAGTVWLDGELFSGRPDLERFLAEPYPSLSAAEQSFLDGPTQELCEMVDPLEVERSKVLPDEIWRFLREHRFFGLSVPPEYGGLGLSNLAAGAVMLKVSSVSAALGPVVIIPNSVGPGKLLLEVGTEEQRRHYLPRLARGDDYPCFALTEPEAGSDAASIRSLGVLFRDGGGELMLRLNWEKRYITGAPVATLLGLAFRLEDPDGLLGGPEDVGITCALVPVDLPGVTIGRRHDPMGLTFFVGPTGGRDVVVPASQIIGGVERAGQGWKMLMESLSGGRAVSLPASAAASSKLVARMAGAYTVVRRQFGRPIARFDGVQEPLARMAGLTYLLEAARVFTCGALDRGEHPAVVSAMLKYTSTEIARGLAVDGMDVFGGAGICRGPRNVIQGPYLGAPINITVEGANILTRTLIVFGQGALRCHPYAHRLLESIRTGDASGFRRALLGQMAHTSTNSLRALILSVTRGAVVRAPVDGPTAGYYRRFSWASARFAVLADLALAVHGGRLKARGKLTGRYADALAWMFLGLSTLRRWEGEGRRPEELCLARWGAEHSLARVQEAFDGIFANFGGGLVGAWLRGPARTWSRLNPLGSGPSDRLGREVAAVLGRPGETRDRLTEHLFVSRRGGARRELDEALELTVASEAAAEKVRSAAVDGLISGATENELLDHAYLRSVIGEEERALLDRAALARWKVIQVDSFTLEELRREQEAPTVLTSSVI